MSDRSSRERALRALSFGRRVAEEEVKELGRYFVSTEQWRRLIKGEVDIVYGHKGMGKSALYSTLLNQRGDTSVILVPGEKPRGTPVFRALLDDPPRDEREFGELWKLYFLQLVGEVFRAKEIASEDATSVVRELEKAELLPHDGGILAFFRRALGYIRRLVDPEAVSTTLEFDPATGTPSGITGKIELREAATPNRTNRLLSVDTLFEKAQRALEDAGLTIWILLDRLDVAFAEGDDLERIALRALFKTYADLRGLDRITPKVFLRNDIWESITSGGLREASHITRYIRIEWDRNSLLNLVARRVLQTEEVAEYLGVTADETLKDIRLQQAVVNAILPVTMSNASGAEDPFDWIISRLADGTGRTTPREIIHLLTEAQARQLHSLEIGEAAPSDGTLLSAEAIREGLSEVSRVRLEQTLFAEHPNLAAYIKKLRGGIADHTTATLAEILNVSETWAYSAGEDLVGIGFFERMGTREAPIFRIPYLYRSALSIEPSY
jgi:hypothetical protein